MNSSKALPLLLTAIAAIAMASNGAAIGFSEYLDYTTDDAKSGGYYTGMEFKPSNDYNNVYTDVVVAEEAGTEGNEDASLDTVLINTTGGSATEMARINGTAETVFNKNLKAGNTYAIIVGSESEGHGGLKFGAGSASSYSMPDEYARYTVTNGVVTDIAGYLSNSNPYNVEQLTLFNDANIENTTIDYVSEIYDDTDVLIDTKNTATTLNDVFGSKKGFNEVNGSFNATSADYRATFNSFAVKSFATFDVNVSVNETDNLTVSDPQAVINTYNTSEKENLTSNATFQLVDGINSLNVTKMNDQLNKSGYSEFYISNAAENGTDFKINEIQATGLLEEPVLASGGVFSGGDIPFFGLSIDQTLIGGIGVIAALLLALIL